MANVVVSAIEGSRIMYKRANRFLNAGRGRNTSIAAKVLLKRPVKPNRQELLLASGMGMENEDAFMAYIQSELRKMVAKGQRNPGKQAEVLNTMRILTATGGKWNSACVVTFYERQRTRLRQIHSGQQATVRVQSNLNNPVLTLEMAAKLRSFR